MLCDVHVLYSDVMVFQAMMNFTLVFNRSACKALDIFPNSCLSHLIILKGGFHCSGHVSKSKYLCSLISETPTQMYR